MERDREERNEGRGTGWNGMAQDGRGSMERVGTMQTSSERDRGMERDRGTERGREERNRTDRDRTRQRGTERVERNGTG